MKGFVSYSRQDSVWVRGEGIPGLGLPPMLSWLQDQLKLAGVDLWIDTRLEEQIGEAFLADIHTRLEECQLVILLISQDFVTSPFILANELPIVRRRHESGEMIVFPILVAPMIVETNDVSLWLSSLQVYPSIDKPLESLVLAPKDLKVHRTRILELIRKAVSENSEPIPVEGGEVSRGSGIQISLGTRRRRKRQMTVALLSILLVFLVSTLIFLIVRQPSERTNTLIGKPVLLSPHFRSLDYPPTVYGNQVTLEWSMPRIVGRDDFEYQISPNQDFKGPGTIRDRTDKDYLILEGKRENSKLTGRLYWQVRLVQDGLMGETYGPWSDLGVFEVYDNALSRIAITERLTVGTSAFNDLFGDTIRRQGPNRYSGIDADIVSEISRHLAHRLGLPELRVQFVDVRWSEMFTLPALGEVDLIISGITASEYREKQYGIKFSRPYYSTAQVAMIRKSPRYTSLQDVLGLTAFTIRGMSGSRVAEALFENHEYAAGERYDSLLNLLLERDDIVVIHDYALLYSQAVGIRAAEMFDYFPIVTTNLPQELHRAFLESHNGEDCDRWSVAVEKDQSELLYEINRCIDILEQNMALSRLIVRHNYPESSLQNCHATINFLRDHQTRATEQTQEPTPTPQPSQESQVQPTPTAPQRPRVVTVPF